MEEEILKFILKYWIEVLLGLVVAGLGFFCKKFHSLWIAEKNHQKTEEQKAFYKGLEDLIQ